MTGATREVRYHSRVMVEPDPQRDESRVSYELLALLVITVLAATVPAMIVYRGTGWTFVLLVLATAVHCGLATFGSAPVDRNRRLHWPYLIVQSALTLGIIGLSRGYGAANIILIPLAAQGGMFLDRRPALAFALFLTIADIVPFLALGVPFSLGLLKFTLASGTGIFFGVLFAQQLRNANRAERQVNRLNRDLAEANTRLRNAAAQTAALATAEERNRLAREIHDSVGHALTTLHVQLEAASGIIEVDPDRSADLIRKARAVASQGLEDVRRAVAAMRHEPLPFALPDALGDLTDKARQTGMDVTFELDGDPVDLAPEAHLTLYRAAQEALTNIRKHGARGRGALELSFRPGAVRLLARNPDAQNGTTSGGGFGLVGLRERAELLQGSLRTAREADEFVFDLEVPIPS